MTVSPTLRSLGFTYAFLSAYCFIVLLASVLRSLMLGSSGMGVIRCGRRFFMVRSNRIVVLSGSPAGILIIPASSFDRYLGQF